MHAQHVQQGGNEQQQNEGADQGEQAFVRASHAYWRSSPGLAEPSQGHEGLIEQLKRLGEEWCEGFGAMRVVYASD
jgi:hypothetical protein